MSQRFEFGFALVGLGWAEATVVDGSGSTRLTASYLGDALGDLVLAIRRLLDGDVTARCSWWEEPGEYRWIFTRDATNVTVRILEFQSGMGNEADREGVVVFETKQPLDALAAEVARASHALLAQHGIEGYRDQWHEHDFPSETLAAIDSALASRRVTSTNAD